MVNYYQMVAKYHAARQGSCDSFFSEVAALVISCPV
jgi:hypothetical protein